MTSQLGPWVPYQPTPSDPWDLRKAAHLHRRAGFGATWGQLQRDLRDGPAASIDRLLRPAEPTEEERQVQGVLRQGVLDTKDAERLKAWWLQRILYGNDPLREKLALFWHCHFATSSHKVRSVPFMLHQNELFHRHALGDFAELHVSSELLPHTLYGGQQQVPSLLGLERFRRRLGMSDGASAAQQRGALDQVADLDRGSPGSLLQFVQRSTVLSYTSSDRLEYALRGTAMPARYPDNNGLGQRLRLVAQLIRTGLGTSIYST